MPKLRLSAQSPRTQAQQGATGDLPLSDLTAGSRAVVVSIDSRRGSRLSRLSAFGLLPGSHVTLLQRHPSLVVQLGETEVALETAVAKEVIVRPME